MPRTTTLSRNLLLLVLSLALLAARISAHSWLTQRTRNDLLYDGDVKGDSAHPCGFVNVYNASLTHIANASDPLYLSWPAMGHSGGPIVSLRLALRPGPESNYTPSYEQFLAQPLEEAFFDTLHVTAPLPSIDTSAFYVVEWQWGEYYSCADYYLIAPQDPDPTPLYSSPPHPGTGGLPTNGWLDAPTLLAILIGGGVGICCVTCVCGAALGHKGVALWQARRQRLYASLFSEMDKAEQDESDTVLLSTHTSRAGQWGERLLRESSRSDDNSDNGDNDRIRKDPWRVLACIVVLIALFAALTVASSSLVIKAVVFPDGYDGPYRSIAPLVDELNRLTQDEEPHFPALDALDSACGHCNTSVYTALVNETWTESRTAVILTMSQVIAVGCAHYHFSSGFCTAYAAGTLDVLSNGVVPLPSLAKPNADQVYDSFSGRVDDRFQYDKNYIQDKLGFASSFTLSSQFSFTSGSLCAADINVRALDAYLPSSDPIMITIFDTLTAAGVSLAPIAAMQTTLETIHLQSTELDLRLSQAALLSGDFLTKIPELNIGVTIDYDPPAVFTAGFNATINGITTPSGPAAPTAPAVEAYVPGRMEPPSFLPNVPFYNVAVVLDVLVALDTVLLSLDALVMLKRLKSRRTRAFAIRRTLGSHAALRRGLAAARNARDKVKRAVSAAVASLRPRHITLVIGLVAYGLLMYLYVQAIYGPVRDPTSYVYDDSYFGYANSLYDYRTTNRFNAELAAITNQCVGEQSELASALSSLRQQYKYNITQLGSWAESYWSQECDLDGQQFDPSAFATAFVDTNATDLCECPRMTYQPRYASERAHVASQADAQVYRVIDTYVISAHLFALVLIVLRLARSAAMSMLVLALSHVTTPTLESVIQLPVGASVSVGPHQCAPGDDTADFNVDYSAEWAAFVATRTRRMAMLGGAVALSVVGAVVLGFGPHWGWWSFT